MTSKSVNKAANRKGRPPNLSGDPLNWPLVAEIRIPDPKGMPQNVEITWSGIWPRELLNWAVRAMEVQWGKRQLEQFRILDQYRQAHTETTETV